MNVWMLTGPFDGTFKKKLKLFIKIFDIHKWSYCIETGGSNYRHIHMKVSCSESLAMEKIRNFWSPYHLEKSNENDNYLRKKDSTYVSSNDTPQIRRVRFGKLYRWQTALLKEACQQDERQVLVLVDELGKLGKSWLTNYLFENHLAYYVPPVLSSPKEIIQFVHSGYDFEEYIVIDIPRSWKWNENLYTAIETIKDGLVFDTRYNAKMRNIRGVKIIIFCNSEPKVGKLSKDRWVILYARARGPSFVILKAPLSLDKGKASLQKDAPIEVPRHGGTEGAVLARGSAHAQEDMVPVRQV